MTDPGTPPALAAALAYHQAWTSQDLDQAMTYIADNITCDAPGARISGAQQYRDFLGGFMTQLTGVQTVAAFGDDTTAVLFYYPYTATISDAPTAECFTVTGGKITRSVLVFDRTLFARRNAEHGTVPGSQWQDLAPPARKHSVVAEPWRRVTCPRGRSDKFRSAQSRQPGSITLRWKPQCA